MAAIKKYPLENERLFLSSPGANVGFRILLDRGFSKEEIEQAAGELCKRHPFLNSFVERDKAGGVWLAKRKTALEIEYYSAAEAGWITWFEGADNAPFDFSKGALVRLCAISGKNTEIIILGHHVLGDGIGFLNLARDFLLALDGQPAGTPQVPPFEAQDRYFKHTELLDSDAQDFARGLNEQWRSSREVFSKAGYLEFFRQYNAAFAPKLYVRSIHGGDFERLIEKSKEWGLTVNELLASAFAFAAADIAGKSEIRLGIAANLRGELVSDPAFCMGNYVTGISANVSFDTEKDFSQNAKEAANLAREQLSNVKTRHALVHFLNEFDKDLLEWVIPAAYGGGVGDYSGVDHPVAKQIAHFIGEKIEDKALGVSNLGRHVFDGYSGFNVSDLQFICPAFPANFLTVGALTANGRLNLCIRYNEAETTPANVKSIYEKAAYLMCAGEEPQVDFRQNFTAFFGPK
ncbi:MAG: condensation domain-containing protein [Spirochaetes bacterium]|nr:condensation domain-containing protein [Spirochaetota bacterium]